MAQRTAGGPGRLRPRGRRDLTTRARPVLDRLIKTPPTFGVSLATGSRATYR